MSASNFKLLQVALAALMAIGSGPVFAATSSSSPSSTSLDDVRAVAPALAEYEVRLKGDVWKRPGLSPRDRSLVTIAVLISRGQTAQLAEQIRLGLDNGLKPAEISETVTHLAFYAGWGQAMAAVPVVREVFRQRHVRASDLPPVTGPRLPLDQASEAQRAAQVEAAVGPVSRGVVDYTGDVLFRDPGTACVSSGAQMLVIRNLDAVTLAELRKAAARNGRGLDAEIASILALHVGTARCKSRSTVDFEGQASARVPPMKSGLRMLLDIKAD